MVTAGMIKERVIGSRLKKSLKSALLWRKNTEKKNHPVTRRKTAMTMYAMGDKK